jgi:PAS domain S-box-containing protein
MYRQPSIRNRLTLVLWGSALLAFVVAGAALALFQNLTLEHRARQIMEPYAQLVSVGTDAAVAFEAPHRAQEILNTLRANPQIVEADIFLDDGRALASFSRAPDAAPRRPPTRPDGIYLTQDTAELVQGLPRGAHLRLSMGLAQLSEQTQQTLWLFGAGVLVLLTATLGQVTVLRRTIVRPIASLTAAAELVRAKADYRHRVPAAGTDEVARLGQSFNTMMEAIEQRDDELRRLNNFQHAILSNAAYGITSSTPDGTVTSFNPAAERLLGYTADEVIGKRSAASWHDPDEIGRRARELSEEFGETIPPGFDVFCARLRRNLPEEHEWTFIRKDGARVPVLVSVSALRDEGGQITGLVGLTYDLTDRKRAEDEILRLNRELEQRVAERTAQLETAIYDLENFNYSASHDLRIPLRAVDGFCRLLLDEHASMLDQEGMRLLTVVRDNTRKMEQLIEDMQTFSRAGRTAMAPTEFDMEELVRAVVEDLKPTAEGRDIRFVIGKLPTVTAVPIMMQRVLRNLLSNAIKFTRTKATASIEVGATANATEIEFFVRDNGVGFDMQYADKLFGVFQRLHGVAEFEGTGIGLAIVKRLISRLGGRVWADSKINEGATIFFSLPRKEKEP